MKKIFVLGCAFFIVGCEDIGGTLQVFKNFNAKTDNGTEVVAAGSYKTSLDFGHKQVVATLKQDSKEVKITFQVPKGSDIPDNGPFNITAAQSGQPFDIAGTNKTDSQDSDRRSEYVSCQYQSYQQVCNPKGCQTIPVTRWGSQFTDYYLRTTTEQMQFDMVDSSATVAHFTGEASWSEKIVTYQSQCM